MKASDWIDRLMTERGWASDYRVAKELDIAASSISKYRNKPESTMDDDTACKVASALNVEPEIVILDQVTERTRSEPARAALSGLLERIRGNARAGGGVKGRLDITSAASIAGGDPAGAPGANSIRPEYTSYKPALGNSHTSTWQQLQAAFESIASYVFPMSPA